MRNLYDLIMSALVSNEPLDYAVICSWSYDDDEQIDALKQCDFYGVVVTNRPSDTLPFSQRKEVLSCQNS